jgi:hypothetical protein
VALPPELLPVDRILQQWAMSVTGGGYEPWAETVVAKPPPLPEDLALEVDQVICHSPRKIRILLSDWYCTPKPVDVIARRIGCTRQSLYTHFRAALWYLRGVFESKSILSRYLARANRHRKSVVSR